jgi:hypothetical protein
MAAVGALDPTLDGWLEGISKGLVEGIQHCDTVEQAERWVHVYLSTAFQLNRKQIRRALKKKRKRSAASRLPVRE